VFIEAAACGKPAIAGVAGGTGAAVLDGITGRRVNGADLLEVQSSLLDALTNRDQTVKLGNAALERVLKEFDWEKVAEKTCRLNDLI
jgi:phosphatidylinositol alpha-1,6-mannosyltransferase